MRIRDWDDILAEVVESDVDPAGWRAVGGDRQRGLGEDMYLAHPAVGAFQLKTYAKNPYQVDGVGSQIARRIDDELDPLFPTDDNSNGMFGVQQPAEDEGDAESRVKRLQTVVETHAEAPTTPRAMLEDVMDALESPAYGPMEFDHHDRPEQLEQLSTTFDEAEELLDKELDDLIEEDVERGFYWQKVLCSSDK